MTAHQISSDRWRRLVGVAIALMLVMVAVLLAAGCVGPVGERNVTKGSDFHTEKSFSNTPDIDLNNIPSSTPPLEYGDDARNKIMEKIAPNMVYEQNMAEWKKKLPITLVTLIDPNYPIDEKSRRSVRDELVCYNLIIPAEKAAIKLTFMNSSTEKYGDYALITIILNQSASTLAVNPYLRKVEQRTSHEVMGWVELTHIEKIASLTEVQRIDFNIPSIRTAGSWYECRN